MNYVLCGMPGSGKSALGKRIAALAGMEWVDVDDVITSKYGEIPLLFSERGEVYFRSLETVEIAELCKLPKARCYGGRVPLRARSTYAPQRREYQSRRLHLEGRSYNG